MNEIDTKFNLLTALANLDVSSFPADNPFLDTESWQLIGQKTNQQDLIDESDRTIKLFTIGAGGQKVIVKEANYRIQSDDGETIHPRITAVFVGQDNAVEAKQWDAYAVDGIWYGEWSYLTAEHAESLLQRTEQELADHS